MKKLITAKTILEMKNHGEKKLIVDTDTLITPSAKDTAREYDIKFVEEGETESNDDKEEHISCDESNPMVDAVIAVLKEKGILDSILD